MRYCRLQTPHGPRYAIVTERQGALWATALMAAPPESRTAYDPAEPFAAIALEHATLLPPVEPTKILCVGRNYRDHAAELGNEPPPEPLLFFKPPSSLLAPGATILLPPESARVDFEGELAIVIGRESRHLRTADEVHAAIRGYTIVNDVTARDLQKKDNQWARAKGFDTFCPCGPFVSDEIDPSAGVQLETYVSGQKRQTGSTLDFLFSIERLLTYITSVMTLCPGDLIPTGTPAGVGPLAAGETVEVRIGGLALLRNPVAAAR